MRHWAYDAGNPRAGQAAGEADAKTYGYYLTHSKPYEPMFFEGLKKHEDRYGYHSCPFRP